MLKIRGTEIQQALTELMMEAAGPLALSRCPATDRDPTTSPTRSRRATATTARRRSTPGPTRSSATSSPSMVARADELRRTTTSSSCSPTRCSGCSRTNTTSTRARRIVASAARLEPRGLDAVRRPRPARPAASIPTTAASAAARSICMRVMEAIGEALVVEPYLSTVGLGARLIERGAAPTREAALLARRRRRHGSSSAFAHDRARRAATTSRASRRARSRRRRVTRSTARSASCCMRRSPTC